MSAFFRNALVYRLTQDVQLNTEILEVALTAKPAREPATQELATYGFIAPFGHALVESAGKALLIMAKHSYRDLSGSVIREALNAKINEIEAEQLRKVYKKERDRIKEDIVQALLPRAFIKHKTMAAMIVGQHIIVDASSPRAAEDLLSTLRECIGSLPVRPATTKIAPSTTLTDWLKRQQAAVDFHVLDECELRDTHEDGGVVRCKRQDLTSEEVQNHLGAGKQVTSLSLAWQDKLSFVIDDKLTIKRLRFEDLLHDQAEADGGDDAHGQQVASLTIAGGTFADFVPALLTALGGEELPEGV